MTAPSPKKQKRALSTLDGIFNKTEHTWVIHYSCESFYGRKDGTSPRITSIAVRNLDSGQTASFSIHQVAEAEGTGLKGIEERYDELERKMLDAFYEHAKSHKNSQCLHWNMRDSNYGFAAIEHRHRVLGGEPFIIDDGKKHDLARLLIDIYGVGYSGHPRLESLMRLNSVAPKDFLNGAGEAKAFDERDYVALHQSTLRKVDVIANLAERAHHRQLKTNTTWWEMHGGSVRSFVNWIASHSVFTLLIGLLGIAGFILTVVAFL